MAYTSKRTGQEIDDLLDKVAQGNAGGGGSAENGVDYAMSIDEPFEEYTIKVDADEEGKRIIKLNVASSLERAPSEFPIPNAEAVINYVDRMTFGVDVTKKEYSAESKEQIAANIGTEKASNTLVKRSDNGSIYAPLIQDDQGLMLAYSSSGDEYKLEADEILLTESAADSRYAKSGSSVDVVDNLTTADPTKALSANMGKELNEKFDSKFAEQNYSRETTFNIPNVANDAKFVFVSDVTPYHNLPILHSDDANNSTATLSMLNVLNGSIVDYKNLTISSREWDYTFIRETEDYIFIRGYTLLSRITKISGEIKKVTDTVMKYGDLFVVNDYLIGVDYYFSQQTIFVYDFNLNLIQRVDTKLSLQGDMFVEDNTVYFKTANSGGDLYTFDIYSFTYTKVSSVLSTGFRMHKRKSDDYWLVFNGNNRVKLSILDKSDLTTAYGTSNEVAGFYNGLRFKGDYFACRIYDGDGTNGTQILRYGTSMGYYASGIQLYIEKMIPYETMPIATDGVNIYWFDKDDRKVHQLRPW